jgi:PAS domain S-box-containing protein
MGRIRLNPAFRPTDSPHAVDAQTLVIQCAVAAPLTFALSLYTWLRSDRSSLHRLLAATLLSVVLWMGALLGRSLASEPAAREWALHLEQLAIALMPPLFTVTMGFFARISLFEQSRAAAISLFSIFALFFLAFLTDGQHHLFFHDRQAALAGAHPLEFAGPLWWGLQVWCFIVDFLGISFAVSVAWRGRTRSERRRAWMILAAMLAPIGAHALFLLEWLPIQQSLAPGALGLSALFFVQGVHRYGLLEAQPLVRQDVIEHIHEGLVLADRDGRVLDANAAAEEVLGRGREEMVGLELAEVLQVLDTEDDLGLRAATVPLAGGRLSGEVRTRDGRHIEISGGAVTALGSQPAGRFVTLRDRSIQRRSERLLRERQKLESVGILAAGVAHEVNNPLSYVRANLVHMGSLAPLLEKALRDAPDDERSDLLELPEILADSLEGLDRIARIVDSMLRFSRAPDEGLRPVDLNDVVEQSLRLAALQHDDRVVLECELAPHLPPVAGASDRLVQVLLNLVLNAKEAVAERGAGRIVVSTRLEQREVVVRVHDDGPGVAPELEARIFDPFFTTRPPGRGTGLGLSIASDIVNEFGGHLELEPGAVGACFALHLPVPREAVRPA